MFIRIMFEKMVNYNILSRKLDIFSVPIAAPVRPVTISGGGDICELYGSLNTAPRILRSRHYYFVLFSLGLLTICYPKWTEAFLKSYAYLVNAL